MAGQKTDARKQIWRVRESKIDLPCWLDQPMYKNILSDSLDLEFHSVRTLYLPDRCQKQSAHPIMEQTNQRPAIVKKSKALLLYMFIF